MSSMHQINLYHLRHFLMVAEEGSVTRGAERATISQPAVSRSIADLERMTGSRLFDRGPKGVTPTEEGKVLLEYARRIFSLEREAGEALEGLRGLQAGRLVIGASTTIGDYLLPISVAEFHSEYPGVEITVEIANTEAIQEGVEEGRFDVGLTEGNIDLRRFKTRVLAADRLVIFASPTHPLARREVTIEELCQHPFVMREAGSGTRQIVEQAFRPPVACSLGSTTAIKRAVVKGMGLGMASVLTIADELKRGELVEIRTQLELRRDLHVIRLGWKSESPALCRFLAMLDERISSEISFS